MPVLLLLVGEHRVLNRFGVVVLLGRDVLGLCGMGKEIVFHGVFHVEARQHKIWGSGYGIASRVNPMMFRDDPTLSSTLHGPCRC